jgi:hypothetical protein
MRTLSFVALARAPHFASDGVRELARTTDREIPLPMAQACPWLQPVRHENEPRTGSGSVHPRTGGVAPARQDDKGREGHTVCRTRSTLHADAHAHKGCGPALDAQSSGTKAP